MDAKGWKYDPCCSEKENKMKVMGFCSNCEFNEGASFCIVSPSIEIAGWKNDRRFVHATSNQCCYNEAGHLITDKFTGEQSYGILGKTLQPHFKRLKEIAFQLTFMHLVYGTYSLRIQKTGN